MPRTHPYLFFSENDRSALLAKTQQAPFAYKWGEMQKVADEMMTKALAAQTARRGGLGFCRTVEGIVGVTGFVYVLTGKKAYGRRAIDEVLAVAAMDWPPARNDLAYTKGANLDIATLAMCIALVRDWCGDLLTDDEKKTLVALAERACFALYAQSCSPPMQGNVYHGALNIENPNRRDWWVDNPSSNWAGVVHGGLGVLCIALYDESEQARACLEYAQKYIPPFIKSNVPVDGGGDEGVMYAQYGRIYALRFIEVLERFSGENTGIFQYLNDCDFGYWDYYMLAPDGKFANFNDMDEFTMCSFQNMTGDIDPGQLARHKRFDVQTGSSPEMFALVESKKAQPDDVLLWVADHGLSLFQWEGVSPYYMIWRRADTPSPIAKPAAADHKLYPHSGYALMAQHKMWMAVRSGSTSTCSHMNLDLGSFIYVYGKERVISDPGYAVVKSSQHATCTLDGEDQWRRGKSKILAHGTLGGCHYLTCDITDGYAHAHLRCLKRHYILLGEDIVVVVDELHAALPIKLDAYLQTLHAVQKTAGNTLTLAMQRESMLVAADGWGEVRVSTFTQDNPRAKSTFNTIQISVDEPTDDTLLATAIGPQSRGIQIKMHHNGVLDVYTNTRQYQIVFVNGLAQWRLAGIRG